MGETEGTTNKVKNYTVLSIIATGPTCAIFGCCIGKLLGGNRGALTGWAVGYVYGISLHNRFYGKKCNSTDDNVI